MELSAAQEFQARELSAAAIRSDRVAELLGVREGAVLRLLNPAPAGDGAQPVQVSADRPPVQFSDAAVPVEAPSWPPPADGSSVWSTVRRSGEDVQVRQVLLWGQSVWINDAGEVWCHACRQFRTTAQISHPFNGCPVGLPRRGGLLRLDPDPAVPDPAPRPATGVERMPW